MVNGKWKMILGQLLKERKSDACFIILIPNRNCSIVFSLGFNSARGGNEVENKELKRGLEARHIQMIALGGTIGVGLFMGSASTIKWTGPSVMLAYAIAGIFIFFIMRAMGEMLYVEPGTGSFATFGHKYIHPLAGYMTAWSNWFQWVIVGMSEIIAVGAYMQYWFPDLPAWVPGIITMVILGAANLISVKSFGEFEFWFAMIKIVTIVLMIIAGLDLFSSDLVTEGMQSVYLIFGKMAASLQVAGQGSSLLYH